MWKRLLTLAVVLILAAAGGVWFWWQQAVSSAGPSAEPTRVIVERGSGVMQIGWQLKRAGVIAHPRLFQFLAEWQGQSASLRAGEYLFPAGVSLRAALDRIARGETEIHFITFPEGLTSQAMLDLIAVQEGLAGEVPDAVDEGSLLPSTYDYQFGTDRRAIVERLQIAMANAVAEAWAARKPDLPLRNEQELVTLASIVEKETGRSEERAEVAGVFINRMRLGMKLQSDPTTIYAMTQGKAALGRGLRRSELEAQHPYNTYHITGLPPGPIANPGAAALMATAQPAETEALFFVADGTGGHAFARTLAEHNRNVARWRAIERARQAAE